MYICIYGIYEEQYDTALSADVEKPQSAMVHKIRVTINMAI